MERRIKWIKKIERPCSDCGKILRIYAHEINEHNDIFCESCLDECIICREKFADYVGDGLCIDCAE